MIRRPPRSTLFPLHDALPISASDEVLAEATARIARAVAALKDPAAQAQAHAQPAALEADRKSTRLNSSHANISYAVFCLKKKKIENASVLSTTAGCDYMRVSP